MVTLIKDLSLEQLGVALGAIPEILEKKEEIKIRGVCDQDFVVSYTFGFCILCSTPYLCIAFFSSQRPLL